MQQIALLIKNVLFLCKILKDKYNLKCTVVKTGFPDQWKISIWKESMTDLVAIVKPYIIDEMKYKFIGYIYYEIKNQSPSLI